MNGSRSGAEVTMRGTRSTAALAERSVVPTVHQVEAHLSSRQSAVLAANVDYGSRSQAWSPIGGIAFYLAYGETHRSTLADPTIGQIAQRLIRAGGDAHVPHEPAEPHPQKSTAELPQPAERAWRSTMRASEGSRVSAGAITEGGEHDVETMELEHSKEKRMGGVLGRFLRQRWTLVLVCTAAFMLLLDITIVGVALPSIQRDLRASLPDLQWVSAAYALMLAVLLLPADTP
jgi:hypothetical protein